MRSSAPPVKPAVFNLTDAGNAEYFASTYGEHVRYDHRRGRWLLWCNHRWEPDADGRVRRLAKDAIRRRLHDAAALDDTDARARGVKWALASESRQRLDALLYLAQAERPLADAGDGWDANPWLLGVRNGVVDLQAGTLRDGRRDDRITMSTAVAFQPAAGSPRWSRFLSEVFAGDAELVAFVHRAIGYSLTGITTEQCLFLLHGTGANGKGTFTNTLKYMLGDYGWNMPFSTIEIRDRASIPNDLAALAGRRFVSASETNDGTRLNEARVKALTGCDPITARFLHGEFFTFEPVAKFWLSVNHRPVVRDDSFGFWRRLRLVPFTQTFTVNPTLADDLRAEAAGILAWAVRGCLEWQRHGLQPPAVVAEATAQYERDSDPLADFINETIEHVPDSEVAASELYEHWVRWAKARGMTERDREWMTATMFGRRFGERVPSKRGRSGKVYLDVARKAIDSIIVCALVTGFSLCSDGFDPSFQFFPHITLSRENLKTPLNPSPTRHQSTDDRGIHVG